MSGALAKGLVVLQHLQEINRINDLVEPLRAEFKRVSPELVPLVTNLLIALDVVQEAKPREYLKTFSARWLQESLKALEFYRGDVDGEYGARTRAAVLEYQKARGLTPDGWAGAITIATIALEIEKAND